MNKHYKAAKGLTGFTSVNGANVSGKSTLVQGVGIAARYIHGFLFVDMSDILKWHRDQKNKSPFMEDTEAAKLVFEKTGQLAPDDLVLDCFFFYLSWVQSQLGLIRHICISGLPRTAFQALEVKKFFPHMRMAYVFCSTEVAEINRLNRIKSSMESSGTMRDDDKPEIFKDRQDLFYTTTFEGVIRPFAEMHQTDGQFSQINFTTNLPKKMRQLVNLMDITPNERISLFGQINSEDSHVADFIREILNPHKTAANVSRPKSHWPKMVISPWIPPEAMNARTSQTLVRA